MHARALLRGTFPRAILAGLALVTGCGDVTGPRAAEPWPEPPIPAPRIGSITEWSASEPDFVQKGVFSYDLEKRLTRYDFGFLTAGTLDVRYYVTYQYEGQRLTGTETYVKDGELFRHVAESEYTYDEKGRLTVTLRRHIVEGTGEIGEGTHTYTYDQRDRVIEIGLQSGGRTTFSYDDVGNLVKEEVRSGEASSPDDPALVYTYSYGKSFNPLAGAPPAYDGLSLVFSLGQGTYNRTGWTSGGASGPPAATGTVTLELNAAGYPVRRVHTATNTALPHLPTVIVSTFEYVEE